MYIVTMTLFGFYIVISFCFYIFIFIIWVVIILTSSQYCSCCCCSLSFCCCIMVTICCCSPDIGLWLMDGKKKMSVPQVGDLCCHTWCSIHHICSRQRKLEMSEPTQCSLDAASCACVCEKVLTHNIAWMLTFTMVHEYFFVYKTVLICFACISCWFIK